MPDRNSGSTRPSFNPDARKEVRWTAFSFLSLDDEFMNSFRLHKFSDEFLFQLFLIFKAEN